MVEVTVDGTGEVKRVKLDPSVVDPGDVEMLEDLVLAAVSEAQRRAKDKLEEEMREATGGLPNAGPLPAPGRLTAPSPLPPRRRPCPRSRT